jgi:hypothetical protein
VSIFLEPELLGSQEPRISWVPPVKGTKDAELGDRAMDLLGTVGLELDPWQEWYLRASLVLRPDGKWAAMEVGACIPRQNGKGTLLEARELVSLFLLPDRLITHSAQQFDTSMEHMRRLLWLIEETPSLSEKIARRGVSHSHGSEGIELRDGSRIRFRTRTTKAGRGFTGDLLVLDEAMFLSDSAFGALLPAQSARPNPQIWYTGSAVDQEEHLDGIVFARVRERGMRGGEERLMFAEWSLDEDDPSDVDEDVLDSREAWAQTNPALGRRVGEPFIAMERGAMDSRTFAVERLGIGDWPATSQEGIISMVAWKALTDAGSKPTQPLVLAADAAPDRSSASIAVASPRADGDTHLEMVDRRRGTDWVVDRMVELDERHEPDLWVVDGAGPIGSLLPAIQRAGLVPHTVTGPEMAQGYGLMVDAVRDGTVRHLGQPALASALKGAARRPLGEAYAWARKSSSVDISPLVACTLALWGLERQNEVPMIQVFR